MQVQEVNKVLHPSATPDEALPACRDEQVDVLQEVLHSAMRTDRGALIYAAGTPGTGAANGQCWGFAVRSYQLGMLTHVLLEFLPSFGGIAPSVHRCTDVSCCGACGFRLAAPAFSESRWISIKHAAIGLAPGKTHTVQTTALAFLALLAEQRPKEAPPVLLRINCMKLDSARDINPCLLAGMHHCAARSAAEVGQLLPWRLDLCCNRS